MKGSASALMKRSDTGKGSCRLGRLAAWALPRKRHGDFCVSKNFTGWFGDGPFLKCSVKCS